MEYVIGVLLLISFLGLAVCAVRGGNLMIGMLIMGTLWLILPLIHKTVELGGDKPVVICVLLSIVTTAIFSTLFGAGAVVAIGVIILPILMSLGIPKVLAVGSFMMSVGAGMYLNPVLTGQFLAFFLDETLMASAEHLHSCLRVEPGKFSHRHLELRAAVAPETAHPQTEWDCPPQLCRLPAQTIQLFQQRAALLVEVFSRRRQHEFPVLPMEELYPEFPLQGLNLLGHSGLRDVTAFGGLSEAPGFHHRNEIF